MEKLKTRVIMLPTEETTSLFTHIQGRIEFNKNPPIYGHKNLQWKYQHLYFISDREIKEGDWYYNSKYEYVSNVASGESEFDFKVEATTDSSLNLPLIGEPFLQKYVEKQGDIKEVMIEMILQHDLRGGKPEFEEVVNTRRDNTVIISPVKDSWTKEEVVNLCSRAIRDTQDGVIRYYRNQGDMINPIKWIADNLQ